MRAVADWPARWWNGGDPAASQEARVLLVQTAGEVPEFVDVWMTRLDFSVKGGRQAARSDALRKKWYVAKVAV